jgi:cell division protein ZapA (FtsZ GTPase activity inhibitor)
MEKIKVTICGRDFNLVTDDAPDIIIKAAEKVEEKVAEFGALKHRTQEEMLMLVALNLTSEAEIDMLGVKNVIGEMHKKISLLEDELNDLRAADQLKFDENMESAGRELVQIAAFRDEENEKLQRQIADYEQNMEKLMKDRETELKELRASFESAHKEMENIANNKHDENEMLLSKIADYEKQIEAMMKDREVEIKRLHDGFDDAAKEMAHIADVKENENKTLRNTLNTYEATFDNYVKLKEEEIIKLRKELNEVQLEYEAFKAKLAKGDEQLSLRRL